MNTNAVNLYAINCDDVAPESNEVTAAKGVVRAYRALDGVSDEMTRREIELVNSLEPHLEAALEVLAARDLL